MSGDMFGVGRFAGQGQGVVLLASHGRGLRMRIHFPGNAQDSPTQPRTFTHNMNSTEAEKACCNENTGSVLGGPGFKSQFGHFFIL